MGKFIKFKVINAETLTSAGGQRDILLDVNKIESIADQAAGAGVVITLSEYVGLASALVAGADPVSGTSAAGTVGGRQLTLTLATNANSNPLTGGGSAVAIAAPTVPTTPQAMASQIINKALTANPGGVASTVQLGLDGAKMQMYFAQASFASSNAI